MASMVGWGLAVAASLVGIYAMVEFGVLWVLLGYALVGVAMTLTTLARRGPATSGDSARSAGRLGTATARFLPKRG